MNLPAFETKKSDSFFSFIIYSMSFTVLETAMHSGIDPPGRSPTNGDQSTQEMLIISRLQDWLGPQACSTFRRRATKVAMPGLINSIRDIILLMNLPATWTRCHPVIFIRWSANWLMIWTDLVIVTHNMELAESRSYPHHAGWQNID